MKSFIYLLILLNAAVFAWQTWFQPRPWGHVLREQPPVYESELVLLEEQRLLDARVKAAREALPDKLLE